MNIQENPKYTIFRGTAMIDQFGVMCKNWIDPEDQGIQYYTISCEKNIK